MKIYTKTGDDGTTGIQKNVRIMKNHPRIIAYGGIDEVNALLGIIISFNIDSDLKTDLLRIQNELFVVGADLSNPNMDNQDNRITSKMVDSLESAIDRYELELSPLTNFILPGGTTESAHIHFARTIVRRAETQIVSLQKTESINSEVLRYVNRLSDLLFVIARVINKRKGKPDTLWKSQT